MYSSVSMAIAVREGYLSPVTMARPVVDLFGCVG